MWRSVFYLPIEEFRTRIRKAEKEAQQGSSGPVAVVSVGGMWSCGCVSHLSLGAVNAGSHALCRQWAGQAVHAACRTGNTGCNAWCVCSAAHTLSVLLAWTVVLRYQAMD